jgi:hypothetical protein
MYLRDIKARSGPDEEAVILISQMDLSSEVLNYQISN